MNGKDLLTELGNIDEKYYVEAETGTLSTTRIRRPLLLAALIALMLLLVGCAVVYVLNMQNLTLAEKSGTKEIYATDGSQVVSTVPVQYQVLTLSALKGSPGYQAAKDWYEFNLNYDQDYAIFSQLGFHIPDFPPQYESYHLYTQEMQDVLENILQTYQLKPQGAVLKFRTIKNMCSALGIDSQLSSPDGISLYVNNLMSNCYENGSFTLSFDITLPEDDQTSVTKTTGILHWQQTDCFGPYIMTIEDSGDWQEWNYTTTSGNTVLILRSPSDSRGCIVGQREGVLYSLMIDSRRDLGSPLHGRSDYQYLSDWQMEKAADLVDSLQPRKVNQADVDNQPPAPQEATQDGYCVELKNVTTDGQIAFITLGITAPDGVVLDKQPGKTTAPLIQSFLSMECLNPEISDSDIGSMISISMKNDGDGLRNTQNMVIRLTKNMYSAAAPFVPGSQWQLRLENLFIREWDTQNALLSDTILAQGEWTFPIYIGETSGDFREIEMISQPITLQASMGENPEVEAKYQEISIHSLVLRRFSAVIRCDQAFYDISKIQVVMKDGSRMSLHYNGGFGNAGLYETDFPCDLPQVDYILFSDGTKLPVPQ